MYSSFNFSQKPWENTPLSYNKGTRACAWNKLINQRQLGQHFVLDSIAEETLLRHRQTSAETEGF